RQEEEVPRQVAQSLIDLLRETHPDAIVSTPGHRGDEVVVVRRERLVEVCRFLKEDPRTDLKLLAQIAGVDLLTYATEATGGGALASIEVPAYDLERKRPVEPRYQVAYNLGSGPGPGPGGAGVPMSQTHVGRANVDPDAYD